LTADVGYWEGLEMFNVVLVEPEIPPNTGNIGRLCLATGSTLHLIEPLGFSLDAKALRRAGLDYWERVKVVRWRDWAAFDATRDISLGMWYLTTKSRKAYWECSFRRGDYLVFGRETRGLPESLLNAGRERCLTIPMEPETRSLNLATSVGIVLYEAMRQCAQVD
jgi:tRNA (cytidine/uridine-2'-O-)-methyltransferase